MNDYEIKDLAEQIAGLTELVEYLLVCCEECDSCEPKPKKSKK